MPRGRLRLYGVDSYLKRSRILCSSVVKGAIGKHGVFRPFENRKTPDNQNEPMRTSLVFALSALLPLFAQAGGTNETRTIASSPRFATTDVFGRLVPISAQFAPKFAQGGIAKSAVPTTSAESKTETSKSSASTNALSSEVVAPFPTRPYEFPFELKRLSTDRLAANRAIIGWEIKLRPKK